jgi:hypothetical protein
LAGHDVGTIIAKEYHEKTWLQHFLPGRLDGVHSAPQVHSQEIGLTPLESKDVAKGYRSEALKLRRVSNDKGEMIGKIDDFIFSQKGDRVFAVLAVGDFTGFNGNLVAVPFERLQVDTRSGDIILPGASRDNLLKLPVFLYGK